MLIRECAEAPAPKLEIREWKTQQQREARTRKNQHDRQFRGILWIAAAVALVAAFLIWRMAQSGAAPSATDLAPSETPPNKAAAQSVYQHAKAAIQCADWQSMHQHVLAPERVKPLMEWFYKKNPRGYQIRTVTGYDREVVDLKHEPATATMRLLTNDGVLHVLLQQTADGWKLDWESFTNVYAVLWADFLKGAEDSPRELAMPLEMETCPPSTLLPSWFATTGFAREDVRRAARLIVGHPTNVAATCWSAEDPVGKEILDELQNQGGRGVKWILQIELLRADTFPPAVKVKSILQKKWNNPPQPQPNDPS
jgi:hypothetical protein